MTEVNCGHLRLFEACGLPENTYKERKDCLLCEIDGLRKRLQAFVDFDDISTYADATKLWATFAILVDKARSALDHRSPSAENTVMARPRQDYHEDMGPVLWWAFPIVEPPYVGAPGWDDWPGDLEIDGDGPYCTHFTPIPLPPRPWPSEAETIRLAHNGVSGNV